MDSTSLGGLPQELLDRVIAFLPSSSDRSNLSLTSKHMRLKTIESLYKNISMTWLDDTTSTEPKPVYETIYSPRVDLLLRSILEIPQYASYMRTLELQAFNYQRRNNWRRPLLLSSPDANLACLARLALPHMKHLDSEQWIEAVESNNLDAIIALLVLQCQNLMSLTLGVALIRQATYIPQILAYTLCSSKPGPALQRLHTVRIDSRGKATGSLAVKQIRRLPRELNWRTYFSFLQCTSLREMEMNLLQPLAVDALASMELPTTSLVCLRLQESSVRPLTLAKVLEKMPRLERLEYEYYFRHSDGFDLEDMRTALLVVKDSLQHLKVACHLCCGCSSINSIPIHGHCSLKDMPFLSTLHISPWVLLGWETSEAPPLNVVLPQSLQHLCFHDDLSRIESFSWRAPAWLCYCEQSWGRNDMRANATALESIAFVNEKEEPWFNEQERKDLEILCKRRRLSCEMGGDSNVGCLWG